METLKTKPVDFFFVNGLFDAGFKDRTGWKWHYFNEAQKCFKKHYDPVGKWRPNPKDDKKFGHYDDDNKWSWTNRINTHPNCCLSFYKWAIKHNPNIFIDFGNPNYHEYNAKKMWEFVDEFFDWIFTTQKTEKYLRELKFKCSKSWNNGNISMIAIILSLPKAFEGVTDIEYTLDEGDSDDMNGVDLRFKLRSGEIKTMQIKSGKGENQHNGTFHVGGSTNDLKYETDYYGYANVDFFSPFTPIIIFENTKNLYKDKDSIVVNEENIIYYKTNYMGIPEKLNQLLFFCGKKNIEFTMSQGEEKNEVVYDETTKSLTITIADINDKELDDILSLKILELKELFK